jgi:hypothetical protein
MQSCEHLLIVNKKGSDWKSIWNSRKYHIIMMSCLLGRNARWTLEFQETYCLNFKCSPFEKTIMNNIHLCKESVFLIMMSIEIFDKLFFSYRTWNLCLIQLLAINRRSRPCDYLRFNVRYTKAVIQVRAVICIWSTVFIDVKCPI